MARILSSFIALGFQISCISAFICAPIELQSRRRNVHCSRPQQGLLALRTSISEKKYNKSPFRRIPCLTILAVSSKNDESENAQGIWDRLAAVENPEARINELRSCYDTIDASAVQILSARASSGDPKWVALLGDLQSLGQERLLQAREELAHILRAGELTVLDRRIREAAQGGRLDPAFVAVLDANLNDAQAAADAPGAADHHRERLQVLAHVYTRTREELEARAEPAAALLHKLLRLPPDQPDIRANVLDDALRPKPEEEHEYVYVGGQLVLHKGAKVSPGGLARAIAGYMDSARAASAAAGAGAAGPDADALGRHFEELRALAADARAAVARLYPAEPGAAAGESEELQEFTELLTPSFQPIMATLAKFRRPPPAGDSGPA